MCYEARCVFFQVVLVNEQRDFFVEVVEDPFGVEPIGFCDATVVGLLCDVRVVDERETLDWPILSLLLRTTIPVS